MSNSIAYRVNKKMVKEAYLEYVSEEIYFWEDRVPTKARLNRMKIPSLPTGWLTLMQVSALEKKHSRWLSCAEESCFVPYCAWCYYPRNLLEDDNEHELCDERLHYSSEASKPEQEATLASIVPALPKVVLENIMSYL